MSQPIFVKVDTQEVTQICEVMKSRNLNRTQCETVLSLTGLPKDGPFFVPPPSPARRGIFSSIYYLSSLFRTSKSPAPAVIPSIPKASAASLSRETVAGDDHPLARSATLLSSTSETSTFEERAPEEQVFTTTGRNRSHSESTLVENAAPSTNDAAVSQLSGKACCSSVRALNAPSGFVTPAMVEFETELKPILTPLQRAIAEARAHGYHLHPRQPLRSFTAPPSSSPSSPTSGHSAAPGLSPHMKQRYVLRAHSIAAGDFFRKEASHRAAVAARNLNLSKFREIPHEERHWYEPSGVIMPEYEFTRLRVVLAPRRFAINHWKTENRGPEDWIEVEERNGRGGAAIFKRDSHLRKELELCVKPKDAVFDKILVGNTVPLDERGTMSPGYQVLVEPEDEAEDDSEEEEEEEEDMEEMTIGDEGHEDAGSDEAHSDETAHDSVPEETILPFVVSRPLPELPSDATPEEAQEPATTTPSAAPAMEKLRRWSKNLKRRAQALTQPQPNHSVVASKMRAPRPRSRSLSGKNEADRSAAATAAAVKARSGSGRISRFSSMRRIKAAASKSMGIGSAGKKEVAEPVVEKPSVKETPKLRIDTGVDRPTVPRCLDAEVAENHRKLLMNKYFNPRPDTIAATSAAALPPKIPIPTGSSQETLLEEPSGESNEKTVSDAKAEEEPVSKSPVASCKPPSIIFYSSPPASPTSPTSPTSPISPLSVNGKPRLPRLQTQMLVPTVATTTTTGDRPKSPIGITLSDKMTEEEVYAHLPVSPKQAIEVFKEHARSLGIS